MESQTDGVVELETLRRREQELLQQKMDSEAEFGQQRAKFIEMFRQKEEALRLAEETTAESRREAAELESRLQRLEAELNDVKSAATIAEVGKEEEMERVQRQHREEVASLRHIMSEAASQVRERAVGLYEQERMQWLKHQQKLELELQELRTKLSQEREGFLASMTKTLQKKVGAVGGVSSREEQDNLEQSMKKAQEDASLLRSVINPLEEEIQSLKAQLAAAKERMAELKNSKKDDIGTPPLGATAEYSIEEKVKELHHSLQTEKSSRTDLEMYVAVLNTQKGVLQDDNDRLRAQLHEVCKLLEQEKLAHTDLQRTWQMANDQFLESQRLTVLDLRRVESVLSTEQQRQITEMKKVDTEREQMERRVHELEQLRQREEQEQEQRRLSLEQNDSSKADALNHIAESVPPGSAQKARLVAGADCVDHADPAEVAGGRPEGQSDRRGSAVRLTTSLTQAQQQSLLDPTPEIEASQSLLASAKAPRTDDSFSATVGRRLVSDREWEALQREVCTARERVGKPCDMCANYESQLQAVQENEKKTLAQLHTLERHLQLERDGAKVKDKYTADLEENLKAVAEDAETQIATLSSKVKEAEKFIMTVKVHFSQAHAELREQLKSLRENREELQEQLTRLQDENDSLVGKHSKHAQELQDESIDFPNTAEEMQMLLLKYREDLIAAKVALEQTGGALRSEIQFLKAQVLSEQQERATMEENLSTEISQLSEELAISNSIACEMDRQKGVREEEDARRAQAEAEGARGREDWAALQGRLQGANEDKLKLEQEVQQLKNKISSLQVDLDNSEIVQRDFVKLSQSLQIQLEKIRASENEVRWQHEEDVDACVNCKQAFNVTHRKHHCRHCGQIFCIDCLTKSVNSGPSLRPSKVCDVCHTILVRDAAPYFCTAASTRTPD